MSMENQQVVGLNERRRDPSVQEMRVIQRVGVKINGQWIWQDYEMAPVADDRHPAPTLPMPQQKSNPSQSTPKRPAPPMTLGRDPAKFVITFGKFFKENGYKPIALENIDKYELADWLEHWEKQKEIGDIEIGASLEVAMDMAAAYLNEFTRPAHMQEKGRR